MRGRKQPRVDRPATLDYECESPQSCHFRRVSGQERIGFVPLRNGMRSRKQNGEESCVFAGENAFPRIFRALVVIPQNAFFRVQASLKTSGLCEFEKFEEAIGNISYNEYDTLVRNQSNSFKNGVV